MSRLLGLRARLTHLIRRRDADARMDEEIEFHIAMETQRLLHTGVGESEARRRALAAFGGVEFHKDAARDDRQLPFLELLLLDVRFALRALRRNPAFTVVAIVTLALGIGTSTTMFSVLNAVALRETQVTDATHVAVLWTAPALRPAEHFPLTFAQLTDFGAESRSFESVAGVIFQGAVDIVMVDGARVVPVGATWVTGNYFGVLGVTPAIGRRLEPTDDAPGAPLVMVISNTLWQRLGGTASIIGQQLTWNSKRYTIVGVMPRGFEYPRHAEAWLPVLSTYPATREPGANGLDAMVFDGIGRLRPNILGTAAAGELTTFLRRADAQRAQSELGTIAILTPFMDRVSGDVRGTLIGASLAVALLLLIACVNVANLLLIRGALRSDELAIRSALGAGRTRLIRQLVTEASLLCACGGVLGIAMSLLAVRIIARLAPSEIPHRELITVDSRVLIVALMLTTCATIVCGLLPALMSARGDLGRWLRGGRAVSAVHRQTHRLRQGLVIGQIALAVLVMVSAGLLTRSLRALQHVDMGFNAEELSIVETLMPPGTVADHASELAVQEALIRSVSDIPGVVSVTAVPKPPFAGEGGWIATFTAEAQSPVDAAGNPAVSFEVVAPSFFETMQVPVVTGRVFDARDRDGAALVAIVSAAVAKHTWPNRDALGQRLKLGPIDGRGEWMTVIGIAADTRYRELENARPTLYLPARQFAGPVPMTLAVRTRTGGADLTANLQSALQRAHPALVMVSNSSMAERLSAPLARPRFGAVLFGAFGVITMLLCVVGVYGSIAATVRERQREFGIRLALGESPASVRTHIMRQGGVLALSGSLAGVAGALVASRLLGARLYGIRPTDPLTYGVVFVVILIAAMLACWIPALRAGRINPNDVLRAHTA